MFNAILLKQWINDLNDIVAAEGLQNDTAIQRQISLIEIEISALDVQLPDINKEIQESLIKLHQSNAIENIMAVLQNTLGYYNLPARPLGENEPPIAPELGQQLKDQLQNFATQSTNIDIYSIRNQLNEALIKAARSEGKSP